MAVRSGCRSLAFRLTVDITEDTDFVAIRKACIV
jgi:hypothetical protein